MDDNADTDHTQIARSPQILATARFLAKQAMQALPTTATTDDRRKALKNVIKICLAHAMTHIQPNVIACVLAHLVETDCGRITIHPVEQSTAPDPDITTK